MRGTRRERTSDNGACPKPTRSSGKAWLRALELTAPIARNRDRILSTVIEELAAQLGDTPALLSRP